VACAKFIVSGKVQGVFFRASARAEAERLRLRGYARNLSDGSVEVVAIGDEAALSTLEAWLHRGPTHARVAGVDREELADETSLEGFSIS